MIVRDKRRGLAGRSPDRPCRSFGRRRGGVGGSRAAARLGDRRRAGGTTTAGPSGSARRSSTPAARRSASSTSTSRRISRSTAPGSRPITRRGPLRRAARLDARRGDLPAALRLGHRSLALARGRGAAARGRLRRGAGVGVSRSAPPRPASTRSSAGRTTTGCSGSTGSRSCSACATGTSPTRAPFELGQFTLHPARALAGAGRARIRSPTRPPGSRCSGGCCRSGPGRRRSSGARSSHRARGGRDRARRLSG